MKVFALLALLASATAFAPSPSMRALSKPMRAQRAPQVNAVTMESYWETKAPPSSVLGGFLSKQSSATLAAMSLIALTVGSFSVVANDAGLPNVNPAFVLGSELTPISWGLHVAAWIQKENGK